MKHNKVLWWFLPVLCALAFAAQVTDRNGPGRRPETDDQDALRYLQDMKNKLAKLEQKLEDRDTRMATLSTQVLKLDTTVEELNARLEDEERTRKNMSFTISELQRDSKRQSVNIMEQELLIEELKAQLGRRRGEEPVVRFSGREESFQPSWGGDGNEGLAEVNVVYGRERDFHPAVNKRSDDSDPIIAHLSQQVTELTAKIQSLKDADVEINQARGTSYVRWGHASCPQSSDLIYSGVVGGSYYIAVGGAANHLCLTSHPVFDNHLQPSGHSYAIIYGSEYEICPEVGCQTTPACAACRVPRAASVMIPGTNRCTSGWTLEYSGYIMANREDLSGSSEFICVDSSHGNYGGASGSQSNDNENLLHYTHYRCGALPCPPYVNEKIVTCVVCSK